MGEHWFEQWQESRFWYAARPATHFDTPSTLCTTALTELIAAITMLETRPHWIVEVGAGDGVLLPALAARLAVDRAHAVDLRPLRIAGVRCWQSAWDTRTESWTPSLDALLDGLAGPGLLVAVEWLDDLPCPVLGPDTPAPPAACPGRWRGPVAYAWAARDSISCRGAAKRRGG